ncbi:TIGR03088 family PEP-CTERM/XrtA system glycosyltransferase [Rugamonas sp. CCM 8940]|uniref:TIGR03088 family PEP-CTERM/XrtA system glycosyltransferase n=1 Tax=Rugamonas sp. CCM 8940 TaxID=2765359 RepID=UPI0018F37E86|nr:TIGR03088 family PEP-CTERM/XrtA system glycosyltransferase [Rugamonas sp. CCM 8940]MBJ7312429.1 TIGR03088 family PEP-CTERM/XrtA system glycosyltransferase [Rugamonas sp. CCM 8940]
MTQSDVPAVPLVVHLIYRFDCGGMETLLVERINRMPAASYRHAVICLSDYSPAFAQKITRPGVGLHALHKRPGLSPATHLHLWRLLRRLRPAVFHSYNLSAIEYAPVALLAGVPVRVNGAHGRELGDLDGSNRKHNFLRRLMRPFYHCCYANSAAMLAWSREVIGVRPARSRLLANGIDTERFQPAAGAVGATGEITRRFAADCIVIGTVGRIQDIKDHCGLLAAFMLLRQRAPALAPRLRLAIVGDGPLLATLRGRVDAAGLADVVWLPGARGDVPALLRGFDLFAISSLAEGTPGAALEAMACGLAVVGTRVGGIPEVVEEGVTGTLVPAGDPLAMAAALQRYALAPDLAAGHGAAGRERVLRHYSMGAMVSAYQQLYDQLRHVEADVVADAAGKKKGIESCAE